MSIISEYPHFVQTKADSEYDTFRFYTTDGSIEEIKREFPNGAVDRISPFYLRHNGLSLNDLPVGKTRSEAVVATEHLSRKYIHKIHGVADLIHLGYQLIVDADNPKRYRILRRSKAGTLRHSYIKHRLLKTIPRAIKGLLKEYEKFAEEVVELNERLWKQYEEKEK